MDILKYYMTAKLIEKYEYKIKDFIDIVETVVEKEYKSSFVGIKSFESDGLVFTYSKTTGCRGQYQTTYTELFLTYTTLINLYKGETQ